MTWQYLHSGMFVVRYWRGAKFKNKRKIVTETISTGRNRRNSFICHSGSAKRSGQKPNRDSHVYGTGSGTIFCPFGPLGSKTGRRARNGNLFNKNQIQKISGRFLLVSVRGWLEIPFSAFIKRQRAQTDKIRFKCLGDVATVCWT